MVIVNSVFNAFLVLVINYGILVCTEKQRNIRFQRKKIMYLEIMTAVAVIVVGVLSPITMVTEAMLRYCFLGTLSAIAVTDWEKHFISNKLLLVMLLLWSGIIGISIIANTENGLGILFSSLLGALTGGLIFLLCYVLSRGQMGAGDVKLAFVMGLYLTGDKIIGAIFYGVILCMIYSVIQLIRKRIGLKDGVPLAPFLYIGTLITYIIMA